MSAQTRNVRARTGLAWARNEHGQSAQTSVGIYTILAPRRAALSDGWSTWFQPDAPAARTVEIRGARTVVATRAEARACAQDHFDALMRGEVV